MAHPENAVSLESADRLYQGFPDFAAWGPLAAEDGDLWDRFAASLKERQKDATRDALQQAVDVAVRAAALDTGAIEGLYDVDRGFTMTVAVQGLAWEQMIAERGPGVMDLFAAQLRAYELVLDAATRSLPITEAWIRSLHEVLCAPQETYHVRTSQGWQEQELPKGDYKKQPNHVRLKDGTFHSYAPVDSVPAEMHRLIEQIRSPGFEAAHPILQASYIHYALVVVHPFADGNGRVARALASIFFYRACSIPFLVFATQKLAYWDALHAADRGDPEPLLAFVRDRGIDTMQLVTESLLTAAAPAPEEIAERMTRKHGRKGLSDTELSAIASRLQREVGDELRKLVEQLDPMSGFQLTRLPPSLPAFLLPYTDVFLLSHSDSDRSAGIQTQVVVNDSDPFRFRITARNSEDALDVREEAVYPELTEHFKIRLDGWLRRQLARALAEIEGGVE